MTRSVKIMVFGLTMAAVLMSVGCVKREISRKDWGAFRIETDAQPMERPQRQELKPNIPDAYKGPGPVEKFFAGIGNLFDFGDGKKNSNDDGDKQEAAPRDDDAPVAPDTTALPPEKATPHPTQ